MDGANAMEKDADLEVEDDADEEVSQQDEEDPQPIEDAREVDDEPADTEGEGDDDEDPEQETNEVENEQENDIDENEEEPLPDGDLEDQEIELQPPHRAEALDVLTSIELEFAMLREWVYVEKMEILAWEDSMVQACKFPVQFIPANSLSLLFSCPSRNAILAERDDQTEGQTA